MNKTIECMISEGHSLEDSGHYCEALEIYRSAKQLFPGSHLTSLNIGNVYFQLGEYSDAKAQYFESLRICVSFPALLNLGNVEYKQSNWLAATVWYERAIELQPGNPKAVLGLAHGYLAASQAQKAESVLLDWMPRGKRDTACLKVLVQCAGGYDADRAFEYLREIPEWDAECWRLAAKLHATRLEPEESLAAAFKSLRKQPHDGSTSTLAFFTTMLTDTVKPQDLHELFSLAFREPASLIKPRHKRSDPSRIRVGYVSGDYKQHAVASYLYPIIRNHSAGFEPVMISNTKTSDFITDEFRKLPVDFLDISLMDDSTARNAVRKLELDILCDCSGQTLDNRLSLFTEYLAPLQFSFIGTALTSGAPAMDYRVVCKETDPPETAGKWHQEKLAWIDAIGVFHDWLPRTPASASPYRDNGYVTIGFLNNQEKMNRETLEDLAQILNQTNAHLKIIGVSHPTIRKIIFEHLRDFSDRIEVLGRLPLIAYSNVINEVDLTFDSFPYTGSTTTLDCLLSGVAVFSRIGERSHSRSSYAWLKASGMLETIFYSRAARVAAIINTCREPEKFIMERKFVQDRALKSDFMNPIKFVKALEELLTRLLTEELNTPPDLR